MTLHIDEKKYQRITGVSGVPVLHLEISLGCNIRCAMCTFHDGRDKVLWTPFSEVEKLGTELSRFRLVHIGDGSEPLVNPDWYKIVSHITGAGAKVSLQTNAKLIRDPESAERIVKSGIHLLSISIDGVSDKTVERIRKGTNFSAIEKSISLINTAKKKLESKTPHLIANAVAMRSNLDELPKLTGFLLANGFLKLRIGFLELRRENASLVSDLLIYDMTKAKQVVESVRQRVSACLQPFLLDTDLFEEVKPQLFRSVCTAYKDQIYVRHDGEMFACYGKKRLGNLYRDGVTRCLTSDEYVGHADVVTKPGNPVCSDCSYCNVMSFDSVEDHLGKAAMTYYSRETVDASLKCVNEGGDVVDFWREFYEVKEGICVN